MKLLVTGGLGFIGSNFIRLLLKSGKYDITNLDAVTYAGKEINLADVATSPHYKFTKGDVADAEAVRKVFADKFDAVVHFAAESHVDRSLADSSPFIRTNIIGTKNILDAVREFRVGKYVHISTDEVYGSIPTGFATEQSPLNPTNPYAASKAAADLLCLSYFKSFGTPVMLVRPSNNYGPYQLPEKMIPLFTANALEDKQVPVYGDGMHVRTWLFVEDCCHAIEMILHKGVPGEVYNVGTNDELPNLEVVRALLDVLKKPHTLIKHVQDRPAHDRRYAMKFDKVNSLGWRPRVGIKEGLQKTVKWYLEHKDWINSVRDENFWKFYEKNYSGRI